MANQLAALVTDIGGQYAQTSNGSRVLGGVTGLVSIGAGSAIEAAGSLVGGTIAGSAINNVGCAITGVGCALTQTAITAVEGVPVIGGFVSGGLSALASTVFMAGPYIFGTGIILGAGYGLYKIINKILD